MNPSGGCGGDTKSKQMEKEKEKKRGEFEFCKVCRINHNDRRRHNYFSSHTRSLSAFFFRFQKKISDVRSCLKSPKFLVPERASLDRIWCVFCEMDIVEEGSSFERHLASVDHLKNLKHFLWKYSGGMNKVDSFRVTEAELSKWEKKCEVLQSEATDGTQHGLSTDIHTKHQIMKNLDINNVHFMNPNLSNDVVPLQYNTNENYQVSHSDISHAVYGGSSVCATSSSLQQPMDYRLNKHISTGLTAYGNGQYIPPYQTVKMDDGTSCSQGNVHSGAPPPWFDSTEAGEFNVQSYKSVKSSKLNPNRVGAAWAEKRKIEMERGEIAANVGADWLPNFGRVWQSGSRKESRKEFHKEKRKLLDTPTASHPQTLTKIQPYISKRMRSDTDKESRGSTIDIE